MKLSKKSEYACLALIELGRDDGKKLATINEIACKKQIPKKYLEQILLQLKSAGYVKSVKGPSGGYMLAKPANQITVAEILRLIDGALAPVSSVSTFFYEHTPIEQSEKMVMLFKNIRDYIAYKLEHTTFADLL